MTASIAHVDRSFPEPQAPLSLWATPMAATTPPASVGAAVLGFGDGEEERDDGCTVRRISAARLDGEDLRLLLGRDLERALDVAVVWDPQEEQIVRVLDGARLHPVTKPPGARNGYAQAKMRRAIRQVAA